MSDFDLPPTCPSGHPNFVYSNFDDGLPTDYYLQFARRAKCLSSNETALPSNGSVFKCLQNADTIVLQNASAYTSYAAKYGQWAFIPVTDGTLIREQPNRQLPSGKVNGERILTGVSLRHPRPNLCSMCSADLCLNRATVTREPTSSPKISPRRRTLNLTSLSTSPPRQHPTSLHS